MREPRGASLVELLVAMTVAAALLGVTAIYSVPALSRQRMRSGIRDVQGLMQFARTEAVKRNRACRFVLDAEGGTLQVWDGIDTAALFDDVLLAQRQLPDSVVFASPDAEPSLSLEPLGLGMRYQTVFDSRGIVSQGAGSVLLQGGTEFMRLTVYSAGGLVLQNWNGAQWVDA